MSVNGCVRIADRSSPAGILHWVLCICSVYKGGRLKEGVRIRKEALLCAFYLKPEQERGNSHSIPLIFMFVSIESGIREIGNESRFHQSHEELVNLFSCFHGNFM